MFKIVANVGEWQTLYAAPSASSALRRFIPEKMPYEAGKIQSRVHGRFVVERIKFLDRGSRPRMILIISEDGLGLEVATRIRTELAEELQAILVGDTLSDSIKERNRVEDYCEQLGLMANDRVEKQQLSETQAKKNAAMTRWLAIAGLAAAISLPSLALLASRNATRDPSMLAKEMDQEIAKLNQTVKRLNSQLIEQHDRNTKLRAEFASELETVQEKIIMKLQETLPASPQQGLASESVSLTLKSSGRSGIAQWETRSLVLRKRIGQQVIGSWIELPEWMSMSEFKVLRSSTTNTNQIKIEYQSASEIKRDVDIIIHVLYREGDE